MKTYKKTLIVLTLILGAILGHLFTNGTLGTLNLASAAPTSTLVTNLFITGLGSSGSPCLVVSSAGLVSTSTCGGAVPATSTISAQGVLATAPFTFATSGPSLSITSNGAGTITFTSAATSTLLAGYSTSTGADPTASVGLSAVNGSASTFLRSDGAPALDQAITPVWTGLHQFSVNGISSTRMTVASATIAGSLFVGGDIGSSANRVVKIWTSALDALTADIATVNITAVASGSITVNSGDIDLASSTKEYKIGGNSVLNATTLGSGVLASSLTSLGTITNFLAASSTITSFFAPTIAWTTLLTTVDISGNTNFAAGNYLTMSGDTANVDPELASTTIAFAFTDATSTAPYRFLKARMPFAGTVTRMDCDEYAAATSTVEIWRVDTNGAYTASSTVIRGITCGIGGNNTATVNSSTIPVNTWLMAVVSSTLGTPTLTSVSIEMTKTD